MRIKAGVNIKSQIFSFTRISSFFFFLIFLGTLFSGSCTKINEFTIGQGFVDPQTRLTIVDTFKVDLSTVLLDSVSTSSTDVALIGKYSDEDFGLVKCETYFDLAFKSFDDLEGNAIFDSAAFIFSYSGYSYGDTTLLMSISLHQLLEKIVPFSDGRLYNNSSFEFSVLSLGSVQFLPAPNSSDSTISINVSGFGEELFSLIKNNDDNVSNEESFSEYIKGFILTLTTDDNNSVIGFTADKDHIGLRFYYHIDKEIPESKIITLPMGLESHQFNNVSHDFSGTLLENLHSTNNEIKSSETGNIVFIQGLTGLMTKVQFPSLGNILMETRWKILKADLVFEPVNTSYDVFSLPERLYIFETDRENRVNTLFRDREGRALLPNFVYDEFFKEDTRYTFDITGFINGELSDKYFDFEHGILIRLEQEKFFSTLDRLMIEGMNPPAKLRLYYLTF